MARKYDLMAAGHLCIDIIPLFHDTGLTSIEQIILPGKLVNVGGAKISTGGPVSNTGISMKTLGRKVCFCARAGDDELGKLTIDLLAKQGNAEGIHIVKGSASSYTIVVAPPGIDRTFLHNPATNEEFCADDLDPKLIAKCRHFHFGYPPLMKHLFENDGDQLQRVFQIAKEAGATTSCDMTLPDPHSESGKINWRLILQKILPYMDVFVPSLEEAFYMLYPDKFLQMKADLGGAELIDHITPAEYSDFADELLEMGAGMTTLKSGHRGFYVKTGPKENFDNFGAAKPADYDNWANRQLWTQAFAISKPAVATGSGDSSIAGFLTAFLNGLNIEQALKYAVCCGWQNVQVLDAVSGIHSWQETTQMIKDDMPMIEANIACQGWSYSDEHKLWAGPNDPLSK
ncbi:carbohydrate kinase family protein [Planctomycetota bacterium]